MSDTHVDSAPEYIPNESEIAAPARGIPSWRIANGQIQTGREEDKSLKVREKVVGRLRRLCVHWGVTKDTNKPYGQLEADIETAEGMIRLKTGISDKKGQLGPTVASLGFARCLLDMAKNELVMFMATQATKPNAYGGYTTYTNGYIVEAGKQPREVGRRPKSTEAIEVQWGALEAELKSHPAWEPRPVKEPDNDSATMTHLSELSREMIERGWPSPEQAPNEWLQMVAGFFQKPVQQALNDYDDDEWGQVRLALKSVEAMPGYLAPALRRIQNQAAAAFGPGPASGNANAFSAEEIDVFADKPKR